MSERTKPPFRADQVGSLIRPDALIRAREAAQKNEIPAAELRRIREGAIRDVVRLQEAIGFKAVTDGEFNRGFWQRDFVLKFANVNEMPSKITVRFHSEAGVRERTPAAMQVTGKLSRPQQIFVEDFSFLKSVAKAMPKVTIPSPSVLHFRGGRDAIDKNAYPDLAEFYADLARAYREEIGDLAKAGCRYLQIDDVNFAYLCDPKMREGAKKIGADPDKLPALYAGLINESIKERPADMVVCTHLCRGNFASAWVAEGGYDPVAEVLFNELKVDGYFLEFDTARAGNFAPLRYMPKGKKLILGLVTSKTGELEKADDLKRRIDEAAKLVPLDQLGISPQCGFSSTVLGNKLTIADQIAKLKLIVQVAREVWE